MKLNAILRREASSVAAAEQALVKAASENYALLPVPVRAALIRLWSAEGRLSMAQELRPAAKKAKAGARAPASTRRGASRANTTTSEDTHER